VLIAENNLGLHPPAAQCHDGRTLSNATSLHRARRGESLAGMIDGAIAWLRGQRAAMTDSLAGLVVASSHTLDKAGVDAAGRVLEAMVPLPCRRVPSARYGDHLFFDARAPGDGGVVIVGHHDTVFPREVFAGWRVDGDNGFGPGALDMKGGLVTIAFALQALAREGMLAPVPLTLAVVADEEVGSPESAEHLRHIARGADAALVFEAGRAGDAIVTRRKGTGAVTVTAVGRAAHAGNAHHLGANAIRAMARFVEAAEALTDYARGVTVNVGRVEGGIGKNTVPERCVAELDLRFGTPADGAALLAALREIADGTSVPGTSLFLDGGVARPPLSRTEASAALRDAYGACQRAAGLSDGESAPQGGGSDASTTADAGVPSIDGLGPRGTGFHTRDERVDLASLVPKSEALLRYLATRVVPNGPAPVLGSPP